MCWFKVGTTLARIAPVIDLGSKPCTSMSCVSQAAYSSAVRLASVRSRHCATILSPSNTANFELVLPTSIASSIPRSPLGRVAQQFSRHDLAWPRCRIQQQRALTVEAGEAAPHQSLAQLDVDFGAERPGLGEPRRTHRLEAFAAPFGEPCRQGCRELLQGSLDRTAEGRPGIAHLRQLRREADIHADAGHDMLHLSGLADRALEQNAGDLAAVDQH